MTKKRPHGNRKTLEVKVKDQHVGTNQALLLGGCTCDRGCVNLGLRQFESIF
ncbi:MAG: hypothetical protein ACI97K_000307 [Glaciecola sp.]|jgi:hypothetical protein